MTPPIPSRPYLRTVSRLRRALLIACAGVALVSHEASAQSQIPPASPSPQWTPAGWGGGGFYFSSAFHPTRDGVLFLGTDVSGVAKSTDHGKTFRMVNTGLVDYAIYTLTPDIKNPDVVYAGTPGGFHRSTDGGETWQLLPGTGKNDLRITAERYKSVRALAVDPTNSSFLYAASPGGKIYKSADGAKTWRVVYQKAEEDNSFGGLRVQFGKNNAATFGGVWFGYKLPEGATEVTGIGFTLKSDGSAPNKVMVQGSTASGILYRSRDLPEVFADGKPREVVLTAKDFTIDVGFAAKEPERAAAAPATPDVGEFTRIDFVRVHSPDQASVLRLSQFFATGRGADGKTGKLVVREFKADDRLMSYGNAGVGVKEAGGVAHSIVVSPTNPNLVLACVDYDGLLLSTDHGETWRALATPKGALHAAFDPVNPATMYGVFGPEGIYRSVDRGVTWTKITKSFEAKYGFREMVINPRNPKEIGAIADWGWAGRYVYSNDGGETWSTSDRVKADYAGSPTLPLSGALDAMSVPKNISINPLNPRQLFIAANWRPAFSEDGGKTWEERVRGADITVQTDIRFSGDRVYVTAMDEGTMMSEDQGKTWKALWPLKWDKELSGHNWRIAVNNINGVDRIIATCSPWDGKNSVVIIISEDGGKTFTTTTEGLPTHRLTANTMWGRGYPRALAVDPTNPKIVYLGIDGDPADGKQGGGVFKSVDGGYTWTQPANQPASRRMYHGLAIDPTDTRRIVWGGFGAGGGIHISEDGGETWSHVFKQDAYIFNVHVAADGTIYAGGNNLWRSADKGKTWKQLTEFKNRSVVGIEVDPRDPKTIWTSAVVWQSTAEGGVFKSTDGGATWVDYTGDRGYRKPMILRFNPRTNELWSGQNVMSKIKQ